MVAVARVEHCHAASEVTFCCVPLDRLAVAVNCCVRPAGIDGEDGVTTMLVTVALPTMRVAVPFLPPKVAVMVVVPTATGVARPVAAPMVATDVAEDVQAAEGVTSEFSPLRAEERRGG